MKKQRLELLQEIYRQSSELLRAIHTERDQVIAFYIALLGFITGYLVNQDKPSKEVLISLPLVMFVLGFIISMIVHHFMKWHNIYVNTMIFIQYLIANDYFPSDKDETKKYWTQLLCNKQIDEKGKLGVERLTFLALLFISFLPMEFLLYQCITKSYLALLLLHILYIVVWMFLSQKFLKDATEKGYEGWLLRFNDIE